MAQTHTAKAAKLAQANLRRAAERYERMRPHVEWIKTNIKYIAGRSLNEKLTRLGFSLPQKGKARPLEHKYLTEILISDDLGMRSGTDGKGSKFFCAPDAVTLRIRSAMETYMQHQTPRPITTEDLDRAFGATSLFSSLPLNVQNIEIVKASYRAVQKIEGTETYGEVLKLLSVPPPYQYGCREYSALIRILNSQHGYYRKAKIGDSTVSHMLNLFRAYAEKKVAKQKKRPELTDAHRALGRQKSLESLARKRDEEAPARKRVITSIRVISHDLGISPSKLAKQFKIKGLVYLNTKMDDYGYFPKAKRKSGKESAASLEAFETVHSSLMAEWKAYYEGHNPDLYFIRKEYLRIWKKAKLEYRSQFLALLGYRDKRTGSNEYRHLTWIITGNGLRPSKAFVDELKTRIEEFNRRTQNYELLPPDPAGSSFKPRLRLKQSA